MQSVIITFREEDTKLVKETNKQLKRIADLLEDMKNCKGFGH